METVDRFLFTSDAYKHVENFWHESLRKFQNSFRFVQRTKGTRGESSRGEYRFQLSTESHHRIAGLAGSNANNVYTCLLSVLAIIIYKCTGDEQIIIDSPLHKRVASDKAYSDIVPMLLELKRFGTLRENISAIQQTVRDIYKFQNYPREMMLFSTAPKPVETNVLITYDQIHNRLADESQYDFACHIHAGKGEHFLDISISYSINLFDPSFIENLPSNFESVLSFFERIDTPLDELSILKDKETTRILVDFNRTEHPLAKEKSIPDIFDAIVLKYADSPAVMFEGRCLTYAELDKLSDRLAYHLIKQFSVTRGDFIGILMDKSELVVVAILGILKTGAAYVPLNSKMAKDRIEAIIGEMGMKAILSQIDYFYTFPELTGKMFLPDIQLETLPEPPDGWRPVINHEDPAYVIYTSGSTGIPKGVVIKHVSVANLVAWQTKQYGIGNGKSILQFFSYSFDGAVGETFMAILTGGLLRMFNSVRFNADDLMDFMNDGNIAVGVFVPSLLKQLDPSKLKNKDTWVVSVGEECPPELALRWSKVCRFANAYGPSEYTVYSHFFEVGPSLKDISIPVGGPISNTSSYILDKDLQIVPERVTGEIYISGIGLFDGYLMNRRLTLEKLKPNPFFLSTKFEDRGMLRSGKAAEEIIEFKKLHRTNSLTLAIKEGDITSGDDILKLATGLDDDLVEVSRRYLDSCSVERKFKSFRRYFLEGFNDSYSSCGINADTFRTLVPFDDYNNLHGIDLGFGNAEVMSLIKGLGANIKGVELSPFLVQKARNKGLDVMMGEIDNDIVNFTATYDLRESSLDFAFSSLVLDRIEYPVNFVKNILHVLRKGGKFAIQTLLPIVPVDDGEVDAKIVYTSDENLISPGHTLKEDKLSLIELLYQNGADEIVVYHFPYVVASRDGVQEYVVWSFTGTKDALPDRIESAYSKMYRTGDLGFYQQDGSVDFVGRTDDQIKLRGFRIELEEIEKALMKFEAVTDVKVVTKDDPDGEKVLVACYVSAHEVNHGELRQFLSTKLPDYMIPSHFISFKSLPLNTSGKFDKAALPESFEGIHDSTLIQPANAIEQQLHSIWARILNTTKIGTTENFFSLGGHSLKATQMIYFIHKEMNVKLDLSFVFDFPTIKKLAFEISRKDKTAYESIQVLPEQENYALSNAQQRIWLSVQLGADPRIYTVPVVHKIKGNIDVPAFRLAYRHVLHRHEILRTVLTTVDSLPRQLILDSIDSRFELCYIEAQSSAPERYTAENMVNEEKARVFDLYKGPLIVSKLLKTAADEFVLVLNFHHMVVDGWSMNIFVNEMLQLYENYRNNESPSLPGLKIQYRDYAAWQNSQLEGYGGLEAQNYWKSKFRNGLQKLVILTDYPRQPHRDYSGAVVIRPMSESTYAVVDRLANENNISQLCVVLAFAQILLNKHWGCNEITVGTPVSGRDHADLEGQIGIFLNILPIKIEMDTATDTCSSTLMKVKESLFEAFRYQYYPFELIIDDIKGSSQEGRDAGINVLVQMLDDEDGPDEFASGLSVEPYPFNVAVSQYELTFFIYSTDRGMSLKVEYQTALFKPETISRMIDDYMELISIAGNSPNRLLADIQLCTHSGVEDDVDLFLQNMQSIAQ